MIIAVAGLVRSSVPRGTLAGPLLLTIVGLIGLALRYDTRHLADAERALPVAVISGGAVVAIKAGPSLLRATLFRAADTARRQDPQLARIYYQQMTERGANHLKASCVVAGHLAERAWTVLSRGTPYVICDNNGSPVTAEQARQIIADNWTVPEEIRKRRRSRTIAGKAPQPAVTRPDKRGDLPRPRSSRPKGRTVNPVT